MELVGVAGAREHVARWMSTVQSLYRKITEAFDEVVVDQGRQHAVLDGAVTLARGLLGDAQVQTRRIRKMNSSVRGSLLMQLWLLAGLCCLSLVAAQSAPYLTVTNPLFKDDMPDPDVVRVDEGGDVWYLLTHTVGSGPDIRRCNNTQRMSQLLAGPAG